MDESELNEKILKAIAEKICKDEIKKKIILKLKEKGLSGMAEIYKEIALEAPEKSEEIVDYPKFNVRIRTLVNSEIIKKYKPKKAGIGNRVFLELTEKGKKIAELLE